jgi:hypothetical protein
VIEEQVPASGSALRKGMWIYCEDAPSGWFLITAKWKSAVISGKNVHLAVNGRGGQYLLDFYPDEQVMISDSADG